MLHRTPHTIIIIYRGIHSLYTPILNSNTKDN
jgi:hypothetical protein